ncbi:MAG: DUF3488 domain-containing protein [Deltaproteobacteria bacterium]|nr:DUF3488 domain-containing protein [Deltaproteobacteria bacterium]
MRFRDIHKLSSYLMVIAAYAAVAFSDELGTLTVALGVVGIAISWFWEPPRVRPDRWTIAWNIAAIFALVYTFLSVIGGGGVVDSFARFLVFLLVAKLFSRVTSRDYLWCYVLAFSLLTAGSALNGDLSYALCFLAFVVFATWALILFHLRREMDENYLLKHADDASSEKVEVERILLSRRIVGPAFLVTTSTVSLAIFLGASLMFFLFPRVGFGLFFQKSRSGLSMAGFSDGVSLGGHGVIRDDPRVVMRVTMGDKPDQGKFVPPLHWRGVAFDYYEGGQWSRSPAGHPTRFVEHRTGTGKSIFISMNDREPDPKQAKRGLRQEIYLEPIDTTVLFGASMPVRMDLDLPRFGGRMSRPGWGLNGEIRFPHSAGIKYVVTSDVNLPKEDLLNQSPSTPPGKMTPYLQLPRELPPRVIQLARSITEKATTPFERAMAIKRFLLANYRYTLKLHDEAGREPVDDFLFERKMGHCEYFSTAMAILLRAVGIPSRNVNGFYGGEWNEYGNYVAVRSGDAHSWVEAWFEGVGWVTLDPTPPGAVSPFGRRGDSILDEMRRMVDTLRLQWFKWIIEYDLARQVGMFKKAAEWLTPSKGGGRRGAATVGGFLNQHKRTLSLVLVGGAVLAVGGTILWRRRDMRLSLRLGSGRARVHPVTALYLRTAAFLARRGYRRPEGRTPREHAAKLCEKGIPGAVDFAALTEMYYAARFGEGAALARAVKVEEARRLAEVVRKAIRRPRAAGEPMVNRATH